MDEGRRVEGKRKERRNEGTKEGRWPKEGRRSRKEGRRYEQKLSCFFFFFFVRLA